MHLKAFCSGAVSFEATKNAALVHFPGIGEARTARHRLLAWLHEKVPGSPERISEQHFWCRSRTAPYVELGYREGSELGKALFDSVLEALQENGVPHGRLV